MEHCVFIHSNPKQLVGAIVGSHALKRNSRNADKFDVRIISTEDHRFLKEYEGKEYLRDGVKRVWLNDDLQSFTPLRFMPPELMGYRGRTVITDPDVFAIGDICCRATCKARRSSLGAVPARKASSTTASRRA
jgi:hypothetical protein